MTELDQDSLLAATAAAGLPPMVWTPAPMESIGTQRPGWWWTKTSSRDVAEVQAVGRRICNATPSLTSISAVMPGGEIRLAVGPVPKP